MVNPFKEVNWNPNREDKRKFAKSLVIGFPALAMVWLLIGKLVSGSWAIQPAVVMAGGGALLGTVLWLVPAIAKPFYLGWYGIACSIGIVISNVLLITFYVLVVTLFGLLRRTFGKQALQKSWDKTRSSYWLDAEKVSDPKRYYSQF